MPTKRQSAAFSDLMNEHLEDGENISTAALDEAIAFIGTQFDPEDIFTDKQLSSWAESNGYVKE